MTTSKSQPKAGDTWHYRPTALSDFKCSRWCVLTAKVWRGRYHVHIVKHEMPINQDTVTLYKMDQEMWPQFWHIEDECKTR